MSEKVLGIIISIIVIGNFFSIVIGIDFLNFYIGIIILLMLLTVLPSLKGNLRTITYALLTFGVLLFIITKASFGQSIDGLRVNLTLVTIIGFVPLLAIPIRRGNYIEALHVVLSRLHYKVPVLYVGSQVLTHVIGVVLNMGSISIMHYLSSATNISSKRIIATAINRGFITSLFLSPYFPAMALILSHLTLSWGSIALYLAGLVLISFLVSTVVEWKLLKAETAVSLEKHEPNLLMDEKEAVKKVKECFLLLLLMISSVMLIEVLSNLSMVIIICSVAILFPLIWGILMRKLSALFSDLKSHVLIVLPKMKSEIVLFFAAGFFSEAFVQTNLSSGLVEQLNHYFGGIPFAITIFITLVITLTGMLGLHPIVTVTIFVTSIEPQSLGFSPEYFAVLLLASWGIGNTVSPASAVNHLISNFWNLDVTDVSYKWNFKYVIAMSLLLPVYLLIIK